LFHLARYPRQGACHNFSIRGHEVLFEAGVCYGKAAWARRALRRWRRDDMICADMLVAGTYKQSLQDCQQASIRYVISEPWRTESLAAGWHGRCYMR